MYLVYLPTLLQRWHPGCLLWLYKRHLEVKEALNNSLLLTVASVFCIATQSFSSSMDVLSLEAESLYTNLVFPENPCSHVWWSGARRKILQVGVPTGSPVASLPSDVWRQEGRMCLLNDVQCQSRQGASWDIESNLLHFCLMEPGAPEGAIT